jgi:hypothetical protein
MFTGADAAEMPHHFPWSETKEEPMQPTHEQGSPEWRQARCGKVTCSRLPDVMTQPRTKAAKEAGELSATATSYVLEIVAETLTGEPVEIPTTPAMRWGLDNEPHARRVYEEVTGRRVEQVGFLTLPGNDRIGGSVDGLLGDVGVLEIKCPYNPREHLRTLASGEMPAEYSAQAQGYLWITAREWADFVSYDPRHQEPQTALAIVRVQRDDEFIGKLKRACQRLLTKVDETLAAIRQAKPLDSPAHSLAHLLAPPHILFFNGQPIRIGA